MNLPRTLDLPCRPRLGTRPAALAAIVVLGLALAACSPSSTTAPSASAPPPSASTAPTPTPTTIPTTITTPEAAAAAVLASDPRFADLKPQDPNLIGECCFWTAVPSASGFTVTIEIGWGDCPAGCINRHHWIYDVSAAGAVALQGEDGPPLPAGVPGPGDGTTGGVVGIRGIATAGPVCPVAKPNDPACADRPVAGALIHVIDATGTEVATLETDALGAFVVTLPPGQYRLRAEPVEGLMGTPAETNVTVGANLALVQLVYDTGIR